MLLAVGQGRYHGSDRLDGQDLCLLMLLLKEYLNGVPGTFIIIMQIQTYMHAEA